MAKWVYFKGVETKANPINTGFLSVREWVEINFGMFGLCKVIKVREGWDIMDKQTGEIVYTVRRVG